MVIRPALLCFALAVPAGAATCTDRVDAMSPQVAAMDDAKMKRLAEYDIKRAHRELAAGDEVECNEAADHLESLVGGH